MKTASIHPGAEVKCNVLGRIFSAEVTGRPAGGRFPVKPRDRNVSYRRVSARQITEILVPADKSGQLQMGLAR